MPASSLTFALVERSRLKGIVAVSACHTDLGEPNEAASGYYTGPWRWAAIRANTSFRVQFGATDDPFIPFDKEQAHVASSLDAQFIVLPKKGHYMQQTFPELVRELVSLSTRPAV